MTFLTPSAEDTPRAGRYIDCLVPHEACIERRKRAAKSFDQKSIYLSVRGCVEFVRPTDEERPL